jgi:hypothetical protein
VELLVSDISERPRSASRSFDIARGGVVARLAGVGLASPGAATESPVTAAVATAVCSGAIFVIFGVALWAQLSVGLAWSSPDNAATGLAMVLMSISVCALSAIAVAGAAPILFVAFRTTISPDGRPLIKPMLLAVIGAAVLLAGGRYFSAGWPGVGGHHWTGRTLVPSGAASFCWAITLSVTSYWVHPAALARFPAQEVGWMIVSPIAFLAVVVGVAKVVRRTELPASVTRYLGRLMAPAASTMFVFLLGVSFWIAAAPGRHPLLFRTGLVDLAGAAVMACALLLVRRASQGIRAPAA